MTNAQLKDRRSTKAFCIVQAGDVQLSQPGLWRVRDRAGSGIWHHVTATTCDCIDFNRSGLACKHLLALSTWSNKQPVCPTCGGITTTEQYYVGGRGYIWFRVCTRQPEHKATRV